MSEIRIEHLPESRRYALLEAAKEIGAAHYRELDTGDGVQRIFFHTVVDEAYAGQGLASRLASEALSDTAAQGHQIVAVCPYIKAYVAKHQDFDAALVKPTSAHLGILPKA